MNRVDVRRFTFHSVTLYSLLDLNKRFGYLLWGRLCVKTVRGLEQMREACRNS
jgi:hypothetical protein